MRLEGKVAIVTGGGKGIGREISLLFSREGAAVVAAGSTQEAIDQVAREIREAGGRALAARTDVADEASVENMVSATLKEFGQIDILVNNAGIIGPTAPVPAVSREDWDQVLAVNLTGTFLCAHYALPHMIERRSGRIINITSIAGLIGYPLRSPYAVSKWGMIGLTKTLAGEVGPYDITVNAIAPGPIKGPRIDEVIRRRAAQTGRSFEEVEREYIDPIALRRMAEESDVAAVALFLASEEGRNITGETLNVSGGYRV
ncbi:MAG TPA: SDR family NAD(P)-dependent oxidoreductase [Blastocatellia bacterium]|nr:SDR family NAD(P)-dependent oxidoreductase [Blastocatellia bacterium]